MVLNDFARGSLMVLIVVFRVVFNQGVIGVHVLGVICYRCENTFSMLSWHLKQQILYSSFENSWAVCCFQGGFIQKGSRCLIFFWGEP